MKNIFLLLLLALYGCISEIDSPETESMNVLVANSIVTNNDSLVVQLFQPSEIEEEGFTPVQGASVAVSDQNSEIQTLQEGENGEYYLSDFHYEPNTTYFLDVESNGFNDVQSFTKAVEQPSFSIVSFNPEFFVDGEGDNVANITLSLNEDTSKDNYYSVRVISYVPSFVSELIHLDTSNPIVVNEGILAFIPVNLVFSDELIESEEYTLSIDLAYTPAFHLDEFLVVEVFSISESLYRYHKSFMTQVFNQQPFEGEIISYFEATEPVSLYSNISGGLGIFGSQLVKRDTVYVD